jgi:hypothetical protein
LLPTEAEADNEFRYYQTVVNPDGKFQLRNLAPGIYLAVAKEKSEAATLDQLIDLNQLKVMRNTMKRSGLIVELKPCQRRKDFVLPLGNNGSGF